MPLGKSGLNHGLKNSEELWFQCGLLGSPGSVYISVILELYRKEDYSSRRSDLVRAEVHPHLR